MLIKLVICRIFFDDYKVDWQRIVYVAKYHLGKVKLERVG